MDVFLEILWWVLVVFIAGLIAQFGKQLADWILANRRRAIEERGKLRPADESACPTPKDSPPPAQAEADDEDETKRSKTEKKRLKAELKLRKKVASDAGDAT